MPLRVTLIGVILAVTTLLAGVVGGLANSLAVAIAIAFAGMVAALAVALSRSRAAALRLSADLSRVRKRDRVTASRLRRVERALAERAKRDEDLDALTHPPDVTTDFGAFVLACHSRHAASCGGDWWAFRRLPGERLLLVIGDVTGHGLPAALVAAHARGAVAALESTAGTPLTPTRVLIGVDTAIRALGDGTRHTTCFAMVLDPVARTVSFANASHCFPYAVVPGDSSDLDIIVARGNPIGSAELCIAEGRRALRPGELFVLHSDGVGDRFEAVAGRAGDAELRRRLRDHRVPPGACAATSLRDAVIGELGGDTAAGDLGDDLTLIVCQYSGTARRNRPRTTMKCRVVRTEAGFSVVEEEIDRGEA